MTKISWSIIIILSIIIISALVSNYENNIKIGVVAPLSGELALYGQDIKQTLDLALENIETNKNIEIIYEDGECNSSSATKAANKLINVDNVKFIITFCSSESLAVAPIAEENKVLQFAAPSTSPELTNAGDYIFRLIPSDTYQARVAAKIAETDLNAKNIAILYVKNSFAEGLRNEFKNAFNGNIVFEESILQNQTDLKIEIQKILKYNPDLIYVIAYNTEYKTFFSQYLEVNPKINILGADSLNDPNIHSEPFMKNYPVRIIFPYPKSNWQSTKFNADYLKKYNKDVNPFAPYEYDALNLLLDAMTKADSIDPTIIKDYLYKMPSFKGITGNIAFDKQGDLVGAEYEIFEIKDGNAEVIGTIN